MKRLFIAVKVELNQEFEQLTEGLKRSCHYDQITWVARTHTHLTLRFLGKTPDPKIPELVKILKEVSQQFEPFTLQLNKLGIFGSRYAPSVIWLGFEEFSRFKQLFETLETQLLQAGFEPAQGNFVPHITLGRIKKIENKKKFRELIESSQPTFEQTIPVNRLILFQSKLNSDGPEYRVVSGETEGTFS